MGSSKTIRRLEVVSPCSPILTTPTPSNPSPSPPLPRISTSTPKHYGVCGKYKAKVLLSVLDEFQGSEDGYYVVVGGITPMPLREGKPTTTVGLCQALDAFLDKRLSSVSVNHPKFQLLVLGGAAGGGHSQS